MLVSPEDQTLTSVCRSERWLDGCCVEPLVGGKSGAKLFRVWPKSRSSYTRLALKTIHLEDILPHLVRGFPRIAESEFRFFAEIAPQLGIIRPKVIASGQSEDGVYYVIVEDLSLDSRFVERDHVWTNAEMVSVLDAYAVLHGRSVALFSTEDPPDWLGADVRDRLDKKEILRCFERLALDPLTADLVAPISAHLVSDVLDIVSARLREIPAALLHNDLYPGNVVLPSTAVWQS